MASDTAAGPLDALRSTPAVLAGVAAAAGFALLIVGGYAWGWTWTGFQDNGTVWDWLRLLVLPTVITLLPFWYRTRAAWRVEWDVVLSAVGISFAVLLAGGYLLSWRFTGFAGKALWDWLELLVLPLVLAVLPIALELPPHRRRPWKALALAAVAAFVVLAVLGYSLRWEWTGFPGNTLWDWLQLLLVPFVVPAAVVYLSSHAVDRQARPGDAG